MRRMAVAILTGLVVIAGVALLWSQLATESTAQDTDVPPAWLQDETIRLLDAYSDSSAGVGGPTSAKWVLTNVASYHEAVPDTGPTTEGFTDKPVYLVWADGPFVGSHRLDTDIEPAKGRQLLLVFDAKSRELSVVGVLTTPVDESRLSSIKTMSL